MKMNEPLLQKKISFVLIDFIYELIFLMKNSLASS